MRSMTTRTPAAVLALTLATAMVAGACSGGDKAGGSGATVILTMANTSSEMSHQLAVEHFAERVAKRSGGELRIKPQNEWGDFEADAERQVVRDVAAGKVPGRHELPGPDGAHAGGQLRAPGRGDPQQDHPQDAARRQVGRGRRTGRRS